MTSTFVTAMAIVSLAITGLAAAHAANSDDSGVDPTWRQRFAAYAEQHAPDLLADTADFARRLAIFRANAAVVASLRLSQPGTARRTTTSQKYT